MKDLIKTKIKTPTLAQNTMRRERLLSRLDAFKSKVAAFLLLSAPAGYGKTTLASDWLSDREIEHVWLSLDKGDNDLALFAGYLFAGLSSIVPDIEGEAKGLFDSPRRISPSALEAFLINSLSELNRPLMIVLDDYHVIENREIHEVMNFLAERSPDYLNIMVISREDPPFNLSSMRAKGRLVEVRMNDLRFGLEETKEFMSANLGFSPGRAALEKLLKRTEGWGASLRLASISLSSYPAEEIDAHIESISGTNRYIIEYLVEEVMERLDESTVEFIQLTSLLDYFNVELADLICGRSDSAKVLEDLADRNLFLVSLDNDRDWYRYHGLVSDFSRARTPKDKQRKIYREASLWFAGKKLFRESVNCAFMSEDSEVILERVGDSSMDCFTGGTFETLLFWIERIRRMKLAIPGRLAVLNVWALFLTGKVREAVESIQFLPDEELNSPEIILLRAWEANIRETKDSLELAREAASKSYGRDSFFRILSLIVLGDAIRKEGNIDDSSRQYGKALLISKNSDNIMGTVISAIEIAFNMLIGGNPGKAYSFCTSIIEELRLVNGRLPLICNLINVIVGIGLYERHRLDEAISQLEEVFRISHSLSAEDILGRDCEQYLIMALWHSGRHAEAKKLLGSFRSEIDSDTFPLHHFRVATIEAKLNLLEGNFKALSLWERQFGLSSNDEITSSRERGYSIYARYLIEAGRCEEAEVLIDSLFDFASERGRLGRALKLLLVRTNLNLKMGRSDAAREDMLRAISAAASQEWYMPFFEMGSAAVEYAHSLRDYAPEFVDRLDEITGTKANQDSLVEALTAREIEILKMMDSGLSNAGISSKLFISIGTTKWHITNILSKLGVKNRSMAVRKARDCGVLLD